MGKVPAFTTNPYPDLVLSDEDRIELLQLERDLILEIFPKYEAFVLDDNRIVKRAQWKAIGEDKNLHVYAERKGWSDDLAPEEPSSQDPADSWQKHMPLILAVGTFEGELNDLMFGTVNPTQEIMRVKASYVKDYSEELYWPISLSLQSEIRSGPSRSNGLRSTYPSIRLD